VLVNSLAPQAFERSDRDAPRRHDRSLSADIARTTTIRVGLKARLAGSCAPDESCERSTVWACARAEWPPRCYGREAKVPGLALARCRCKSRYTRATRRVPRRWPWWSRLPSPAVWLALLRSERVADASTPRKPTRWGSVLPPSVPVTTLIGVRLASLGTKVRAAEADIPYAASARRATLVIVGGHVVHHRR
jgi:hypothetical protein